MNTQPEGALIERDRTHSVVFKGMRRSARLFGLPLWPLLISFATVWVIQMFGGLAWWLLLLVILPTLWMITKHDDKAFLILWLGLKTRFTNRNRAFWGGSSYAPLTYSKRRPWRRTP
ncbi:MAG: VirB3 family type IV secretion system protein [Acidithiobacillus sp.]